VCRIYELLIDNCRKCPLTGTKGKEHGIGGGIGCRENFNSRLMKIMAN